MARCKDNRLCSFCLQFKSKFTECYDCGVSLCKDCAMSIDVEMMCCDCFASHIIRLRHDAPRAVIYHA